MATLSDGTYTGLRASLGDWLHRSDLTNTDYGNFVYMYEAEFNTAMRLRKMEAQTSIVINTSNYITHPSDWQAWKSLKISFGGKVYGLNPISEENSSAIYGMSSLNLPQGYVVRGDRTYVYPLPDATYTVDTVYIQGVPSLSANSTNWLMTKFPHAYLYGSLMQASQFVGSPEKIQEWRALHGITMDQIEKESKTAQFYGAVPTVKPDRFY